MPSGGPGGVFALGKVCTGFGSALAADGWSRGATGGGVGGGADLSGADAALQSTSFAGMVTPFS